MRNARNRRKEKQKIESSPKENTGSSPIRAVKGTTRVTQMTRWKHGNRREESTCAPTANSREGATSNVPNVSGLELCGSSDHAEVAEAPRVRQAGNPGATSHICHPIPPTGASSHVPESSPRGPGSAPPNQKGSRSGAPRNVRQRLGNQTANAEESRNNERLEN